MRGYYKLYKDGLLVAEAENVITNAGRRLIADFLAGNATSWAGAIAIGVGNVAAANTDTRLGFEFYRTPVLARSVNYGVGTAGAHVITVKGTVDNSVSGSIYELGIYSDEYDVKAGAGGGILIAYGDSTEPWYVFTSTWDPISSSPDTTNDRLGIDSVVLGTGNYRYAGISLDLSAYSGLDVLQFAMMKLSGTVSTLTIRFNTDDANYFSYAPTVASAMNGGLYTIGSFTKSNWSATGSPDWANITSIEFITTGTNTYLLDGIRICDTDTNNPSYALISHSILGTPQVKSDGSQMDIEYYVEV